MLVLGQEQFAGGRLLQNAALKLKGEPARGISYLTNQAVRDVETEAHTSMLVGVMAPHDRVVPALAEAKQSVRLVEVTTPTLKAAPDVLVFSPSRKKLKGVV